MDSSSKIFPLAVDVEEGKVYTWCGCVKSSTPPLCDKPEGMCEKAVNFKATLNELLFFCSCGRTQDPPFCDGSHAK